MTENENNRERKKPLALAHEQGVASFLTEFRFDELICTWQQFHINRAINRR